MAATGAGRPSNRDDHPDRIGFRMASSPRPGTSCDQAARSVATSSPRSIVIATVHPKDAPRRRGGLASPAGPGPPRVRLSPPTSSPVGSPSVDERGPPASSPRSLCVDASSSPLRRIVSSPSRWRRPSACEESEEVKRHRPNPATSTDGSVRGSPASSPQRQSLCFDASSSPLRRPLTLASSPSRSRRPSVCKESEEAKRHRPNPATSTDGSMRGSPASSPQRQSLCFDASSSPLRRPLTLASSPSRSRRPSVCKESEEAKRHRPNPATSTDSSVTVRSPMQDLGSDHQSCAGDHNERLFALPSAASQSRRHTNRTTNHGVFLGFSAFSLNPGLLAPSPLTARMGVGTEAHQSGRSAAPATRLAPTHLVVHNNVYSSLSSPSASQLLSPPSTSQLSALPSPASAELAALPSPALVGFPSPASASLPSPASARLPDTPASVVSVAHPMPRHPPWSTSWSTPWSPASADST